MCVCVCVSMCVRERERESERMRKRNISIFILFFCILCVKNVFLSANLGYFKVKLGFFIYYLLFLELKFCLVLGK